MKKFLLFFAAFLLILTISIPALAATDKPLDLINAYLITVEPETNGHLRLR